MKPIEETELTSYKDSVQQQESPEKASLGTAVVENSRIAVANKTEGVSTREEQKPVNETVSNTSPSTSVAVILDLEVSEKSEKKSSSDGQQQSLLKSSVEKSMASFQILYNSLHADFNDENLNHISCRNPRLK